MSSSPPRDTSSTLQSTPSPVRSLQCHRQEFGESPLALLGTADLNPDRLNLARLLNNGHLPANVVPFMIGFGLLFALSSGAKAFRSSLTNRFPMADRLIAYLPSGIAFAVGFLNAPSFSLARLIGGYIAYRTAKASGSGETPLFAIVIASGFVLGEGVLSIVTLALTSAGFGAISCIGCRIHGGGYCAGTCS